MTLVEDVEHIAAVIGQTLVGLFFMLGGAGWFVYEIQERPPHTGHLIAAGAVSVFGAAVLPSVGPWVLKALKGVATVVQSFLPARPPAPPAP
jgi:hypothetical protein